MIGTARPKVPLTRSTAVAMALLFLMMAAHAALESARDAFLLGALSPVALLWSYVIIAVLAVAGARISRGRRRPLGLPLLLCGGGAAAFAFWLVLPAILPAGAVAFYVFTALYVTVVVPRFWLLLTGRFTVGQAKRYYTWIGLGGIAGAATGSALSTWLLTLASARSLLLLGGGIYVLAAVVAASARGRPETVAVSRPVRAPQHEPQSYVRRLVWSALLASATFTVVDYLFKSTAAATVPKAELASYFARAYTGMNVVAFAAQIALAPMLLRRLGTHAAAMLLPLMLLTASGGFALAALPALALIAKGADGALRNSLHRVTSELLYFPLSDYARDRWKGAADALGQRGGQALGAVVLLGMVALGAQPRVVAVLAAVFALAWALMVYATREPYLTLFRQGLRRGGLPAAIPVLASDTLQAILEAFSSSDDAVVCAAIELLADNGSERLVPSVLVHHPSQRVALRALDVLARSNRTDLADITRPLIQHADGTIRATALRVCMHSDADLAVLLDALRDDNSEVRATAMLCLLDVASQRSEARARVHEVLAGNDTDAKLALLRALQADPRAELAPDLPRLLDTPHLSVRKEALRAMSLVPRSEYLPMLLPFLTDHRLLADVRRVIVASSFGNSSVVESWLADVSLPPRVRRHLPRTLSAFGTDRAAGVLLSRLDRERDSAVRYKILRGLGRMRTDRPSLPLDARALHRLANEELDRAVLLLGFRAAVGERAAGSLEGLLHALLQSKEERALENVFRVLGIMHPQLALEDVWRGTRAADVRAHDAALELVATLSPKIRTRLLAVLQRTSDETRLRDAGGKEFSFHATLEALTHDDSVPVSELAKALVGTVDSRA